MADVQSNIHVNIDTSDALASLKLLQRQISAFHTQMAKSGTAAAAVAANQAQNLMNSINATGQFQASMRSVTTSTESFTNALERNKLTSREYFRYTGAATKTFGRLFRSEFETINKVARERVKDIQTQYVKLGRGANGALQAIAVRPLTLDMKNLGTQTAIAAQRQQLLNQLLKQGSTNLLNFGKNTQWAGRQLMVGFTVPLAMLGATASKTFMKLEEQAIRFKRVYGELFTTQEETDVMVKNIQLLAKEYTKYGVAVEDTMKMAADAAAMGKMGADLIAQVAQATRLAVLGGVEQTQALETTISVTNAFGVATEDLAKKIDFLNAVENQTVVSIEDLTIAMPKAGPVVQQLGGDVEDLAFFLTAMKEGGINASEGANALKSGLASLINPSEKASKMLMGLGVNIKGIVEANKGDVKSTVIDFAAALDTLDPLNRARAIEQLFGKFQFSRLSTLFQNVIGEGTQAARVLKLTNATTEELAILSERELSKIQNTTTYKFKKSMEDLKVAIAPVGEQFLKALTPIVEFVGKILDKFNNLGDGSKKFLTILTVAVAGVGPVLLMSFGLIANAVANIIKMFAGLKSMYNRTGSSSKILGEQTNYLTKEQLEASAVAASLDQVHTKLRQTFTSETTAVNALANAYRRAIAAQMGFTGPPTGKRMPKLKYTKGTTSVPGPAGAGDIIPIMASPGEAVIPAHAAQDPANRPFIAHMVAGGTIRGFHTGTTDVQHVHPGGVKSDAPEKMAFAHAAAPIKYNSVGDIPDEFSDKRTGYQARGIAQAYGYTGIGFDIPGAMNSELKAMNPSVDVRAYEAAIKNPEAIKTMTARLMGPPLQLSAGEALRVSSQIRANLLSSLAILPDGTKINDSTVYRRMGSIKQGILGGLARDPQNKSIIQRMLDPHGIGIGSKSVVQYNGTATPKELLEAQRKATNADKLVAATERLVKYHPNAVVQVIRDANGNITAYKKPEVSRSNPTSKPTKFNNGALLADGSFTAGRAGGDSGAVSIKADSKSTQAALRAIKGVDGITAYGEKDKNIKDVGRSNPKHRHITGVYTTADGQGKVFVKPMINLENALAEQRAATILRDAHGLDVPEQRITMVKDPVTKRLVYALESAFDPKFAGANIPATFSKDEYFRQLLASSLRGDKDLGRGNLGGRLAPDVGTAYIYDEATQYNQKTGKERVVSDAIKSVGHQALINVGGVAGSGAKKFFADATRDIALSMSPDEYQRRMLAEIDRVIPQLETTIKKFGLTGEEAKPYQAIIERLKEARSNVDWTKIHAAHTSAGKVAITPEELVLNKKTGKTRKPKKEKLPKTVKSSGGPKDTAMIAAPAKNEQVVKPWVAPKKIGKVTIPGFSDAPHINISEQDLARTHPRGVKRLADPVGAVVAGAQTSIAEAKAVGSTIGTTLSQSAAAASRTLLYGNGPIDAEAKSVRRRLQKEATPKFQREKMLKESQAKAAASRTALYGTGPMDADAKSLRRQMEKRSKIAAKIAYQERVISQKAAVAAQAQMPMLGPNRPTAYDKTIGTVAGKLRTSKVAENFRGLKASESKIGYLRDRAASRQEANRQAGRAPGMGMGSAMGVASGVAMIGSMAPGKVGEISQKIMMPLMGMAMIMPMLQNKFSALAVGVGLAVAAFAYQRMAFDKAQNAALELTDAMGSGTRAIKALSEFSTKVGAGEIMDKRRKDAFSPFQTKTGKTTFGESYMAGEGGKAMAKNVTQTIKMGGENGKAMASGQVADQLMTAVVSGVLDPAQARSIAANLGEQLGDQSFGIEINSKLISMLGPNGENILKDGVELEVKLLQDTRTRMNLASDAAQKAGGYTSGDIGKGVGFSVAGGVAGAAGGAIAGGLLAGGAAAAGTAIAGAATGAAIGSAVPVVGTIIGAALGVGVGYFLAKKDRSKRIGEASGASIAMQKIALQQQKELNDSVELRYQKELEIAKAKGDQVAIDKLNDQYEKDQVALLAENAALVTDIQNSYANAEGATQSALMTGADKAITKQYEGTPLEDVAVLAKSNIDSSAVSKEMQYTLKMQMASGQIDPMQMLQIFETFGDNAGAMTQVVSIIGKFGGDFANQAMGIVGMFEDKKQAATFIANIEAKGPKEAKEQLELFQRISQSALVVNKDVLLNYYNSNPDAAKEIQDSLVAIDAIKGKATIDIVAKTEVFGAEEMALLKADQEYFDKLPAEQQKVYLQNMKVMMTMEGDPAMQLAYKNWLAEKGEDGKTNAGKSFQDYVIAKTQQKTEVSGAEPGAPVTTDTTGTGNKVQSSPLDDLVKKLRDVRKNQIKVTEGWSASRKALDGLFGGKKTLDAFSGIENDIRKIGGSEDLIELIVGMDPKEYEKKKKSLFKFDNKGNIIGLKKDAKNIQEALNSIAMGDFNSKTEAETEVLKDQAIAFNKLASIGVPVADAYAMVENAGLAQAIAMEKNSKSVAKLAANYKVLNKAQLETAAFKGVNTDVAQFKKDAIQEARIKAKYNPETAFAINSDENLKLLEAQIAAKEKEVSDLRSRGKFDAAFDAQKDLTTFVDKFNERLAQLKNTISFMQDMFDKGFSNAMEAFDVQETALNIQFKLDTKSKDTLIKEAQDQIAAIQYKVDDKEAALKAIEDQEQKINDKYDERIEALDEIEKANAAISNQQRGQLTLAEALTSGDIAAAARAAQDMRAQQAADAVTKQKDAVEQSRQYELDGLTAMDKTDGKLKTRKQLEQEIKDLQDEVFKIEEDKIEPAQEFIRLRQIQLDKDIEGITVLGRTRDAWEAIKNQVDLALIASASFVDSMGLAISTQGKLIAAYKAETGGTQGAFVNPAAFVPVPGETPEEKAAREAAAKAAADKAAADKAAADKAAADKAAADKAAADKAAAEKARLYAIDTNSMVPSFLASQESGAIGAASIAAKMAAAAAAAVVAKNANTLANFKAKENAENAAAAAAAKAAQDAKWRVGRMHGGIIPKMFSLGGFAKGTDTVPAMLTPGEFIMSKYAVDAYGVDTMRKINNGESVGGSVYNNTYTLTVNAKTNANPNEIAQAVMSTIKQVDDRRIRGINTNVNN